LLGAFAANLSGILVREGLVYQSFNVAGAAVAASASWLIAYMPFFLVY